MRLAGLVAADFSIKIKFKPAAGLSVADIRALIRVRAAQESKGRPMPFELVVLCTSARETPVKTWESLVRRKLLTGSRSVRLTRKGRKKLDEVLGVLVSG